MRPYFVAYETNRREEMLSQLGGFTPNERDVFHKLCKNWEERIPYTRFTALLNREDGGTISDLLSLMEKLTKNRMGLIRSAVTDGVRSREAIIVTEEDAPRFFAELADEYFTDMLESISNPLPRRSLLEERVGPIPDAALISVNGNALADYFSGTVGTEAPLAFESVDGQTLLLTQRNLRSFANVAILKLRYFLSNSGLLGAVAKLLDTSLLSLKQECAGKSPEFWLTLASTVCDHRRELEALRTAHPPTDFFHAATVLRRLIESQIEDARRKKEADETRNLDLEALAMAVRDAPEEGVPQEQLTRMLEGVREKYGNDFGTFQEEFYERYVRAHGKNTLPKLVQIHGAYFHRDNVFPTFLEHIRRLELELKEYFVTRMSRHLRSGSRDQDSAFVDRDNFDAALFEALRSQDPFVAALADKPSVLAEALILHAKQNRLAKDVQELKQRLALYFDPETMQPLPLSAWFNVSLLELYDEAFENLPLLRRIWFMLSGRHETLRARYLGGTPRAPQIMHRTGSEGPAHKRSGETRRSPKPQDSGSGKSTRPAPTRSGTAARTGSSGRAHKRAYSKKQVDSAWTEFGSTIKKGSGR